MNLAGDSNIVVGHIFRGIFGRKCSFIFKIYYFCSGSIQTRQQLNLYLTNGFSSHQ